MAKKRANGEGSIRKRSDGRWEGRYTAGRDPETGKHICKNVLGKTQAEVKEKLAEAIERSKGVDMVRAGKYTLGQWMEVWFENVAQVKVRPSSHATYRGYLDNHIRPNIGDIPLHKLTTLDLQRFYREMLDGGRVDRIESQKQPKGLSPKTVRNLHQVISSNPAEGCSLPRLEHREMQTLTADQLEAFFREAKASGVFELYYLELATGLRRGELLGLHWEDIDLEQQMITVRRQVVRINGVVTEAPLKTKNSYRTLSIGADAAEILRQQKEKVGGTYVFPSPPWHYKMA